VEPNRRDESEVIRLFDTSKEDRHLANSPKNDKRFVTCGEDKCVDDYKLAINKTRND